MAGHSMPGYQAGGGVDNATVGTSKMTGGSMFDTALGVAVVEFRGTAR